MRYNILHISKKLLAKRLITVDICDNCDIKKTISNIHSQINDVILKKILSIYDCNFNNSSFFNRVKQAKKTKNADVFVEQMKIRLNYIYGMFGRKLLEEYDIKIIYNVEFDNYSYDDQIYYFKEVCLKITSVFKYYDKYINQYYHRENMMKNLLSMNMINENIIDSDQQLDDLIIDTD